MRPLEFPHHKTFRLTNVLKKDLERLAKKLETNKSGAIRFAITEAVNRHLKPESRKK